MDVLDHSCSKLGFGGKMCIDGTFKYDEESDVNYRITHNSYPANVMNSKELKEKLQSTFAEIKEINISLLQREIPCLVLSVEKSRRDHIRQLHESITQLAEMETVKMVLYVEHTVNANDLPVALWRFCNNLDPKRDHSIVKKRVAGNEQQYTACIGFDGTIKTKEYDNFYRDWPNIIVASDETIKAVDEKWSSLGIGEFIASPSLKYKEQMYGEEAVVKSLSH